MIDPSYLYAKNTRKFQQYEENECYITYIIHNMKLNCTHLMKWRETEASIMRNYTYVQLKTSQKQHFIYKEGCMYKIESKVE